MSHQFNLFDVLQMRR